MFYAALECPDTIARNEDDYSEIAVAFARNARALRRAKACVRKGKVVIVAVRCSVLQCVAIRCSVLRCVAQRRACTRARSLLLQSVAVCCSVLQCVAIRCSVLQCVFQFSTPSRHIYMRKGKVVSVVVCCSVLQCVAHPYHHVRVHKHEAFMLQCVAVCSMIHRSRDI